MSSEQTNFSIPPPVWLHVNGVSLANDIRQHSPNEDTYDYRTKHLQSPVEPDTAESSTRNTAFPYDITTIDGLYIDNNPTKQYRKLENTHVQKKFFLERQINKVKSLPGLIKGTALSRNTPLHLAGFTTPSPLGASGNTSSNDHYPIVTTENEDDEDDAADSLMTSRQENKIRRQHVYFADVNKVHFIEDDHELSQQNHLSTNSRQNRFRRRRITKKPANKNDTNFLSPSIQQPQILQHFSRPLSRQTYNPMGPELSIKKQQLLVSPRIHSTRTSHIPEIPSSTCVNENSSNEISNDKYVLQRERPITHLSKRSSIDTSIENQCNNATHPSHDVESTDNNTNGTIPHITLNMSSAATNRQRPSLNTISLRQQFMSLNKSRGTTTSMLAHYGQFHHTNYLKLNIAQSASFRQQTVRTSHDENDSSHSNKTLLTASNRPTSSTGGLMRQARRSDLVFLNSKSPFRSNSNNDFSRSERFQNLLTIVRPPFAKNHQTSLIIPNATKAETFNLNYKMGNVRTTQAPNTQRMFESNLTSQTITV